MATLLVVDDEQDIRDLVVKRLVREGHKVMSADGGLIALALIERHGMPDAAILDLDMPGMNGFDLLARLRVLRPQLPALFLTVLWGADVHAGVQAASAAYVAKPFSAAELATGVRWLLGSVHDLDGARE
jgi:DNA-binding response OmpR family regulator